MNFFKYKKNYRYYRNRIQIILTYVNVRDQRVLDLGCGEMILWQAARHLLRNYTGMDELAYQQHPDFIQADICNESTLQDKKFDCIFLLGVLDHLDFSTKQKVLSIYKSKFESAFILSQYHSDAWYFRHLKVKNPTLDPALYFDPNKIKYIYLLKLPGYSWVFNLTNLPNFLRNLSTERIAIISDPQK